MFQRPSTPPRWLQAAALACFLLAIANCPPTQNSQADRVLILLGKSYEQYQQVASAFSESWKSATGTEPVQLAFPSSRAKKNQLLDSKPSLVVGLGEIPTVWALGREEDFRLGFAMVVAPERMEGFAKLLSTRSRKLSGVSIEICPQRQLKLLLTVMPNVKRIGVLTQAVPLREQVSKLDSICEERGLDLIHIEVSALSELPSKLSDLLNQVDLIWSLPDPAIFQSESAQHIISQCAERKVPLLGLSTNFVKAGATISFDPDYQEVGQLLARQCLIPVDEHSANLTMAAPRTIVVSINERSFRALGLKSELDLPGVRISRF
jgi:putative ABC transport system substrate-binding protein